jgi:hypothetical protein
VLNLGNEVLYVGNKVLYIGNDVLYVWNKVIYVGNKVLYVGNEVFYVGNEVIYVGNKVLYVGNKVLYVECRCFTLETCFGWSLVLKIKWWCLRCTILICHAYQLNVCEFWWTDKPLVLINTCRKNSNRTKLLLRNA